MADANLSPQELESLHRRWEQHPTPQRSLRLAEEYRRAGELRRAAEVLERDLADHPDHTSSHVALGRYLLELGEPRLAAERLEAVATQDPTHLVANKYLIRAYAAVGEHRKAVDRLDLYELLNEGDPELEDLRRLVESAAAPEPVEPAAAPETARPTAAADPPPAPEPEPEAAAEPFAEFLPEEAPRPADLSPPPAGERQPIAAAGQDPFADPWRGHDDGWYRHALAAEGIFAVGGGAAPAAESRPEPAEAPVVAPRPGPAPVEPVAPERAAPAAADVEPAQAPPAAPPAAGRARPGGPLTAAELLRGAGLEPDADRDVRFRALLRSYIGRLRAGAAGDV